MTSTNAGRKRVNAKTYTADDQALGQIAREAEAKLAAKRAARNEAREIRMRELEKQQKENEEKQDRLYELTNDIPKASMRQFVGGGSSRRGSEDSTTDEGSREVRSQLAELDEKYKKAMMGTAQLHNEKQSLVYEVELLKDQLEEREEEVIESQREFRDKCKELESKKRSYRDLEIEFKNLKIQIEQRDKLIEENGLAIIISDEGEWTLVKASAPNGPLTAGLPTMGMVNSRLASEMDPSLAWDEEYKQNKCTQTDNYRVAPIVGRRPKATQTDEPDPTTFRKAVDTTTIETQTDDVPELLKAAIIYAEQITQTQSKPLEISEEEKYCQLIEYYRDIAVQTVESKFAPWTASHTIEELPPRPKTPPRPRTPTPPSVEVESEDDEIEKLRVEMDEDPIFDPSKFRKRMSLVDTSRPSKQLEKKANKKEVEPLIEIKPSPAPSLAPAASVPEGILSSDANSTIAVPEVQRQESIGIDQIVEIVDEPIFDPSQYKKRLPTEPQPTPASESTPSVSQPAPPEVQRQESVGFDQIFDDVEEPVFDPSRYMKRFSAVPIEETQAQSATKPKPTTSQPAPPPPEVKRQESVGFDQIFDNEEEPVFDPSKYLKRFSTIDQSTEQPPQPSPSRQDKNPCEAPVMNPSSLVNESSSVSSCVNGNHKTNANLQTPSNVKSDQVSVSSQTPESHLLSVQEKLHTFCSQLTQTDDDNSVPEPGTNLSIPPPCGPEPETNVEVLRRASSDSTVYDSALSLNGSTVDLHNGDRMSRGRSSIDSTTTDINNKRYESNRDLASISRKNSALTNGQRSIFSREGSPKLSSISSRANSLRSIYSPEPVTQTHMFSSRETSVEPRSEGPTSILDENQLLKAELKKLNDQLEEERSKKKNSDDNQIFTANGPEMQLYEIQREASKQIHEYKLKLQKAEQDIATLEGSVNRLDTQVKRYRTEAEDSEKLEDELKQEKRKLMRELREAQSQIEELRNHNSHLQKRLEKMKQSRSALVK